MIFLINTDGDPFSYLGKDSILDGEQKSVQGIFSVFSDYYSMIMVIAAIGLVCIIAIMAIKLMVKKKANERAEVKDVITWKLYIFAFLFAIPTLWGVAVTASSNFATGSHQQQEITNDHGWINTAPEQDPQYEGLE